MNHIGVLRVCRNIAESLPLLLCTGLHNHEAAPLLLWLCLFDSLHVAEA